MISRISYCAVRIAVDQFFETLAELCSIILQHPMEFIAVELMSGLVAIFALGKYVFRLLDDYRQQKRNGIKEPTFHRHQLPEIEADMECWE